MAWQPISETDLQYLMANELGRLNDAQFQHWERYGLKPEHVQCERRAQGNKPPVLDPIYVIARAGNEVLVYDDVDEEFGTGTLDADGVLRQWGTWGEALAWSLERFPQSPSAGAA
jgi:hypothetical protein